MTNLPSNYSWSMRLRFIFLFSILSLLAEFSNAQKGDEFLVLREFPSYEEVVLHFLKYHDTSLSSNSNFSQFNFMRKPQGWYTIPEFYDRTADNKTELIEIWDKKSGFVIFPSDKPVEISLPGQYTLVLSNSKRYDFVVQPFYGYIGWDEDAINYFKKIKPSEMSDHELYGLSRAYSHKASNIFWAHSLYSDPEKVHSSMTKKSDIKMYLRLSAKSISLLKELYSRNTDYQTLVGLIDVKLPNQVMAHWYELTLFGFDKKADEFLKNMDIKYDDFWANSSKYLLQNLKENAIFISNGDNDTYPHLWNQAVNKIRNDVLIVNSALLNDPEYFAILSDKNGKTAHLISGLSREQIKNLGQKQLNAINDTASLGLSFADIERSIIQQSYNKDIKIFMEYGYYKIPFLNERLEPDSILLLNASKRQISFPQFLLTGIVYYNLGLKPIYFTKPMNPDFQQLISPEALLDEGMGIRLTNDASNYSAYGYSYFDTEKAGNLLKDSPVKLPESKYFSRQNFYQLFLEMQSRAISYDIDEHNLEIKQKEILEYLRQYPPQLAGISLHYYNLIYTLFQYDLSVELAQMFLKAYIIELENQIRDTELIDSDPNDFANLRKLSFIINSIIRSELESGIPNFYENLFMLDKSINNKLRQMPEVKLD